jgi:hypothetical protein
MKPSSNQDLSPAAQRKARYIGSVATKLQDQNPAGFRVCATGIKTASIWVVHSGAWNALLLH